MNNSKEEKQNNFSSNKASHEDGIKFDDIDEFWKNFKKNPAPYSSPFSKSSPNKSKFNITPPTKSSINPFFQRTPPLREKPIFYVDSSSSGNITPNKNQFLSKALNFSTSSSSTDVSENDSSSYSSDQVEITTTPTRFNDSKVKANNTKMDNVDLKSYTESSSDEKKDSGGFKKKSSPKLKKVNNNDTQSNEKRNGTDFNKKLSPKLQKVNNIIKNNDSSSDEQLNDTDFNNSSSPELQKINNIINDDEGSDENLPPKDLKPYSESSSEEKIPPKIQNRPKTNSFFAKSHSNLSYSYNIELTNKAPKKETILTEMSPNIMSQRTIKKTPNIKLPNLQDSDSDESNEEKNKEDASFQSNKSNKHLENNKFKSKKNEKENKETSSDQVHIANTEIKNNKHKPKRNEKNNKETNLDQVNINNTKKENNKYKPVKNKKKAFKKDLSLVIKEGDFPTPELIDSMDQISPKKKLEIKNHINSSDLKRDDLNNKNENMLSEYNDLSLQKPRKVYKEKVGLNKEKTIKRKAQSLKTDSQAPDKKKTPKQTKAKSSHKARYNFSTDSDDDLPVSSLIEIPKEEPDVMNDDLPIALRRKRRIKVKPLKFWKGERIIYKLTDDGLPGINGISKGLNSSSFFD